MEQQVTRCCATVTWENLPALVHQPTCLAWHWASTAYSSQCVVLSSTSHTVQTNQADPQPHEYADQNQPGGGNKQQPDSAHSCIKQPPNEIKRCLYVLLLLLQTRAPHSRQGENGSNSGGGAPSHSVWLADTAKTCTFLTQGDTYMQQQATMHQHTRNYSQLHVALAG